MSETRDGVIEDLLSIKGMTPDMLRALFTHPNIAIVDREAELPEDTSNTRLVFQNKGELHAFDTGYFACGQEVLKATWVKEVSRGPSSK